MTRIFQIARDAIKPISDMVSNQLSGGNNSPVIEDETPKPAEATRVDFGFDIQKKFFLFDPLASEDLNNITCVNYGLYINDIVPKLNSIPIDQYNKDLKEFSESMIKSISGTDLNFINNQVPLCAIDDFCNFISEEQLKYLENGGSVSEFGNKFLRELLKTIFSVFSTSESTISKSDAMLSTNKMGFPFSRVVGDLVSALLFFKENQLNNENKQTKKDIKCCTRIVESLIETMQTLEIKVLNEIKPVGAKRDIITGFPLDSPQFQFFNKASLAIENCKDEFNEIALDYRTGNSNKNHFVVLFITNRFFALTSMLKMVSNFIIKFDKAHGDVLAPEDFIKYLKESYIHISLTFADFSKLITIPSYADKISKTFVEKISTAAQKFPAAYESRLKLEKTILNDPKFDPTAFNLISKTSSILREKFYALILPEKVKKIALKKLAPNYLQNFFGFLRNANYSKNDVIPFPDLIYNFYLEKILKGEIDLELNSFKGIVESFLNSQCAKIKDRLKSFKDASEKAKSNETPENIAALKKATNFINSVLSTEKDWSDENDFAMFAALISLIVTIVLSIKVYHRSGSK